MCAKPTTSEIEVATGQLGRIRTTIDPGGRRQTEILTSLGGGRSRPATDSEQLEVAALIEPMYPDFSRAIRAKLARVTLGKATVQSAIARQVALAKAEAARWPALRRETAVFATARGNQIPATTPEPKRRAPRP